MIALRLRVDERYVAKSRAGLRRRHATRLDHFEQLPHQAVRERALDAHAHQCAGLEVVVGLEVHEAMTCGASDPPLELATARGDQHLELDALELTIELELNP